MVAAGVAGLLGVALSWGAAQASEGPYGHPDDPEGYVAEAPLPEGFPRPGPIGEAVVKQYPAARMAAHEGAQFMRLFGHISREDIPMTAPVLMEGMVAGDETPGVPMMAFYYPSMATGEAGADAVDGSVEVVDSEPMTVVSYAFFGARNAAQLTEAMAAIEGLIEDRGLAKVGSPRIMGYNGPGVPWRRKLVEVQQRVEVEVVEEEAGESAGEG